MSDKPARLSAKVRASSKNNFSIEVRREVVFMNIKEVAQKFKLRAITIYVATGKGSCPFACSYCFLAKNGKLRQMSIGTLHKSIDFLRRVSLKPEAIYFFGTEPLMRFDLIKEARKYAPELKISLTTNGWLLTDKRIEWMARNNVKIFIYSIDGGAKYHNKHRRTIDNKPTWARVAKNFQRLLPTQGKWITTRGTWSPEGNDYDLVGRFKALTALGASSIAIVPVMGDPSWDEKRTAQAYMELADYYKGETPPSKFIIQALYRLAMKNLPPLGNMCNVGHHAWSVLPDGTLLICHNGVEIPDWRLGNINSKKVNKKAIATAERVDKFYEFRDKRPECVNCPARNLCMGVGYCAAENLRYGGNVINPPKSYCIHLRGFATGMKYWLKLRKKRKRK